MRILGRRRGNLIVALAVVLWAGHARAQGLAEKCGELFNHADFAGAKVSAVVVDVASGKTVYERGGDQALSLASNTKLVTTAAALDRLGPGYEFRTVLARRGTIRADVLEGDLVVRGGGDPCLGGRFDGEADAALRRLARALREAGVRRVTGDLIADDRFLDREWQHPDWPKDQADRWYEAPVSALSLNDGCLDVSVAPGARPGAPAVVTFAPAAGAPLVELENTCVTTASRKEHVVDIGRRAGGNRFVVRGAILAGEKPTVASIGVTEPALLFAAVLRDRLKDEGIEVAGKTRVAAQDEAGAGEEPIAVHASLLAQALPVVNKRSQNHYAEQLLKVLGAAKGGEGSWKGGLAVEAAFLDQVGIERGTYAFVDGSGLARGNKMSARGVARLLTYMAGHEHASAYLASLAVAGVDGTLAKRLTNPALRGRVLAKTGTINGVSALSGYVFAKPDATGAVPRSPKYVFSILVTGCKGGAARAHWAQDGVVEVLALADAQGSPGHKDEGRR